MIKPNVTSWRYINVSNAFNVTLKMNDNGNRYGFTNNVDTHMMKNSEWGAIAYLSQSKYGKLGNENFSGANKEVYQNKSDKFITGCSFGKPSGELRGDYGCQYTYNKNISGAGASTTGTIYGIYDMSGGAWEYVMGNYNDVVGESGFTLMPESKYYNKYTSDNIDTACNGKPCLSHALSETKFFYNDSSSMINQAYPWLVRGGHIDDNSSTGLFYYDAPDAYGTGGITAGSARSYRITLIK